MWTVLITAGVASIAGLLIFSIVESDRPDTFHERPSAAIPKRYAGTWSGKVKDSQASGTSKVRITLPRGRKAGTSTYGSECTEKLVPVRARGDSLTLHEIDDSRSSCIDAWITVVPADHHRLRLTYASTMDGKRYARATVTRKKH